MSNNVSFCRNSNIWQSLKLCQKEKYFTNRKMFIINVNVKEAIQFYILNFPLADTYNQYFIFRYICELMLL